MKVALNCCIFSLAFFAKFATTETTPGSTTTTSTSTEGITTTGTTGRHFPLVCKELR